MKLQTPKYEIQYKSEIAKKLIQIYKKPKLVNKQNDKKGMNMIRGFQVSLILNMVFSLL